VMCEREVKFSLNNGNKFALARIKGSLAQI